MAWQDVKITTVDLKKDYEIIDIISVAVSGSTWKSEAKSLGLEIATGWADSGTLDNLFAVAGASLRYQAEQMGANAVIGTEFDISKEEGFSSIENLVVGFGTAVKY